MLAIGDFCLPHKLHFKTRILCHQKRYILFLYSIFSTHLRRMMALSGVWGDREGIFAIYFFFLKARKVSAWGVMAGSPAGRFRGEGKDLSRGHSAKKCGKRLPWENHGRSGPWRCQVPQIDPKNPCHDVHTLLPPQLCLNLLQSSFGCPWLYYLHGIVTLALTGSTLMQEMIIKFVTVNCSDLTWLIQELGPFLLWLSGSLGCVRSVAYLGYGVLKLVSVTGSIQQKLGSTRPVGHV